MSNPNASAASGLVSNTQSKDSHAIAYRRVVGAGNNQCHGVLPGFLGALLCLLRQQTTGSCGKDKIMNLDLWCKPFSKHHNSFKLAHTIYMNQFCCVGRLSIEFKFESNSNRFQIHTCFCLAVHTIPYRTVPYHNIKQKPTTQSNTTQSNTTQHNTTHQ